MTHALPQELTARRDNGQRGSRLGDIVRRLSSTSDGEIVAAVHAIWRLLAAYGADILGLVDHIEQAGGGLTEEFKQKVRAEIDQAYDRGYADGVQAAESKQHGTGAFRNTDGTLEWTEVALFVQRQKHRLDLRHHDFIDDMASRTVYGREPAPKQHQYLHNLFYKLGGKIT
jgi:hypothetical protein